MTRRPATLSGSITPGNSAVAQVVTGATGSVDCQSDLRQDYAGFQLGQDLARLNI